MADDERCAQRHSRHFGAQPLNQLPRPGTVHVAVHIGQYLVGNMLQRNIHIAAHLGIAGQFIQHILREALRIGIMYAQPLDSRHFGEGAQHICKTPAAVQVEPVVGGILGNQQKFLHSGGGKLFRLFHYLFDGH